MPVSVSPLKLTYPRPPLIDDHSTLFQEPVYEDGEPYMRMDEDDDSA